MTLPRLRDNIAALGALQITAYIIPLITIPYLTRVLGLDGFGKLMFVQAIVAYVVIITDYGFTLTATRKISANRTNKQYISEVFWATWGAQWLLALASILTMISLVSIITILQENAALYYVGLSLVIGNLLFPIWIFQGLERMREVAIINACSRLLTALPIFFLVKSSDDLIWVLALSGAGAGVAGIGSLIWIRHKKLIYWKRTTLERVFKELAGGKSIFLSKVSTSLYTISIPVVLGFISGTSAVGYFALANKLKVAVQGLLSPISQALYPRMSLLYSSDPEGAYRLVKKSATIMMFVSASASIVLFIGAPSLIYIIAGEGFFPAVSLLRWLAFIPLIAGVSNIFGVQVMLPNDLTKPYNIIISSAAVICLTLVIPIIYWLGVQGAAIISLSIEIYITSAMGVFLFRNGYITRANSNKQPD